MRKNRMGNLLSIAGDDAEDIKKFIDSFLSQDSESDDSEEKCVDFCKIIAVADSEDEEGCLREWVVKQNASNTSVIHEGEGQPPAIAHLIFFDSEEVVPAIVRALANKRPDLYFRYEFCDEDAQYAGELVIEGGYEHGELYEPRGEDTIVWRRRLAYWTKMWKRKEEWARSFACMTANCILRTTWWFCR